MAFHKEHTAGELIERIDGDVDALSNFFSRFVVNLISNVLLVLGVLILLFQVDWRVGLTMSVFAALALVILMLIRRRAVPYWVQLRQVNADFSSFLEEQLAGIEDTRGNGATGAVMRLFYLLLRRWRLINRKAEFLDYLLGGTTLLIFIFGSALSLSLGAYLWSIGVVSVGTVYLMWSYTDRISGPIQEIQTELQDLQQAEAGMRRIAELFQMQPTIRDGKGNLSTSGAFAVEFCDVSFAYTADDMILKHLSFHLPARKILGVVGRTGSGKTSLVRLLFRLYDAQSGEVCLDSIPINTLSLRELRHAIGMVTQDVQTFQATVRDNLTFFNRSIPDARMITALKDVGLSEWFYSLPKGLDTELGSGGEGLSAGEAQLLAFARIFLTDPGLVILDEASSRLDPATERLIEQATTKLFSGRTSIIIAHRLETLQRVDEILVLEDGYVLEYGHREDLANDPASRFAQLLKKGLEEVHA
jgi:ABC-type multidrug transport system fused ATPase/permease subunit